MTRECRPFSETVGATLTRSTMSTLQVNLGKRCNQACTHCHVEAGPARTEVMTAATADRVIALMREGAALLGTLDLTGGAPELNPEFRRLVLAARACDLQVIDRCNLTVLHEPGQEDTAAWLAEQGVQITASLPCYSEKNVDTQRGRGVFEKSIAALQELNRLGYGDPATGLRLDLVYNPGGPFLPPAQASLEADYKARLANDFGIVFDRLLTITNMPIKRFRWQLDRQGQLEAYMALLSDNYNPSTVEGLMCLHQISVGWDGQLYDCDFNQMLELPAAGTPTTIWDIEHLSDLLGRTILVKDHCFGCTAGAGSSCGGSLA